LAALLAVGVGQSRVSADETFTWSGLLITGESGVEYPNFTPEGEATYSISGNTLTIELTYTGGSETIMGINQTLSGLTWDLEGYTGTLTADSAVMGAGSTLIGVDAGSWTGGTDLSGQWAYSDSISESGLGSYGVGAVGGDPELFGHHDIIDSNETMVNPAPGGIDFALVGPDVDLNHDGFRNQGPIVQNSMIFTFTFTGTLTEDMITNVMPLFGSAGAPLTPEPATIVIFGAGLVGARFAARRWRQD